MCHDELTMMMYADGELSERERRAVDVHLSQCSRCLKLVAALRTENRALAEALQETAWSSSPDIADAQSANPIRVLRTQVAATMGGVALSAAVLRFLVESAEIPATPTGLAWLSPFHADGLANVLFNAAVYVVQEGGTMMSSLVATASASALTVLALSVASVLARRIVFRSGLVGLVALCVVTPAAPSYALEIRRSERDLTIASDQTVDDTLVAMGESIVVDGTVTGDLIAMGRRVRVRGTVKGNVFAFAQEIDIDGVVEGGVFEFGQTLTTRGHATRNLYAFGQTVDVPGSGRIDGNATTFSQTATIEGHVGQDVTSFGQRLDLGGRVDRRVTAYGERVTVLAPARIEGDLTAHVPSKENVRIDSGATVRGATNIQLRAPEPSDYLTVSFYVRQCIRLVAAFVTGWLLFWLVPAAAAIRLDTGRALFALDPVSWTLSERRIRCPRWPRRNGNERDAASVTSSRPGRCGWSSTRARP